MPQITDQKALFEENELRLISKGPARGWTGDYLKCPSCGYFVFKGAGYDACPCGNIVIDSDYCRVTVKNSAERDVECYEARPKANANTGRQATASPSPAT